MGQVRIIADPPVLAGLKAATGGSAFNGQIDAGDVLVVYAHALVDEFKRRTDHGGLARLERLVGSREWLSLDCSVVVIGWLSHESYDSFSYLIHQGTGLPYGHLSLPGRFPLPADRISDAHRQQLQTRVLSTCLRRFRSQLLAHERQRSERLAEERFWRSSRRWLEEAAAGDADVQTVLQTESLRSWPLDVASELSAASPYLDASGLACCWVQHSQAVSQALDEYLVHIERLEQLPPNARCGTDETCAGSVAGALSSIIVIRAGLNALQLLIRDWLHSHGG